MSNKSEWVEEVYDILHELKGSGEINKAELDFVARRATNVARSSEEDELPDSEDFVIETVGRLKQGSVPGVWAAERRYRMREDPVLVKWANDAILVQDAVNLSGIVHSFSKALSDLRASGIQNTADLNRHPISVLFSSKIASLTGSESFDEFSKAYQWAKKTSGKE